MKFHIIKYLLKNKEGKEFTKTNMRLAGKSNVKYYGEVFSDTDEIVEILEDVEMPDFLEKNVVWPIFHNSGNTIKDNDIVKELFLFNINILPGEKYFELNLRVDLMKNIFNVRSLSDLIPHIIDMKLHILDEIIIDKTENNLYYKDIKGNKVVGSTVVYFNDDTFQLYTEYIKSKYKDIKTFDIE